MEGTLSYYLKKDLLHLKTATGEKKILNLFLNNKNVRIVVLFRILNYYHQKQNRRILTRLLLKPINIYYELMTNRYCIDLPVNTSIGPGFKLNHAYGIVINGNAIIGSNVYIGHNVTIGSNGPSNVPTIGDNVTIFTGSIVVGKVSIGDNVIIGAGCLVIKSISPNTVVGGNVCKILKTR